VNREPNLRSARKTGGTLARREEPPRRIRSRHRPRPGASGDRQDANEPKGEFTLQVVDASFPARQSTAQHSVLRLSVRNTDDRELPNLAVTVETKPANGEAASAFALPENDPRLADPNRPVWILDRAPEGGQSATRTPGRSGPMFPGETATSSGG
jgi:hypothetical protein